MLSAEWDNRDPRVDPLYEVGARPLVLWDSAAGQFYSARFMAGCETSSLLIEGPTGPVEVQYKNWPPTVWWARPPLVGQNDWQEVTAFQVGGNIG